MNFHIGDWVSFNWNDGKKIGRVEVYDRNGTFYNPEVPSVDVNVVSENCWYKHIPVKDIILEHDWAAGQQDDAWYGCDY